MSKRTFQPNNRRRAKTHGFRLRMRTRAGRAILGARRRQGPLAAVGLSRRAAGRLAGCAARPTSLPTLRRAARRPR